VRATLVGPVASSSQISSSSPGNIPRPLLPATFELVGRDSGGVVITYGFELKQWFVNRGDIDADYTTQNSWCSSIGYSLPRVRDLTNAVCTGPNWHSGCLDSVGATPSSPDNCFMRHPGAGFFTEWGFLPQYTGAGFVFGKYWTSDIALDSYPFTVFSYEGGVDWDYPSYSRLFAVCASALIP
jgi:hypothetical protein